MMALFFILNPVFAVSLKHDFISPHAVDSATQLITGSHLVWSGRGHRQELLLISLGGTGSHPEEFQAFDEVAANRGYRVLAIDYPNSVISTICRDDPAFNKDPLCFDHFREGINLGKGPGVKVPVDFENSVEHRIESLVVYLAHSTRGNQARAWRGYLTNDRLNWAKIVLVGHSQGSGHAAFLAKVHKVHGVFMFSGPQDSSILGVAHWVGVPGATPRERYFAFGHKEDRFGNEAQIRVARELLGQADAPIYDLAKHKCPPAGWHILRTTRVLPGFEKDAHNSLTRPGFSDAWNCLLDTQK